MTGVQTCALPICQRLGIAAALLGNPQTLILDEPINGLDPEGIRWIRGLLRQLAAQGRTVLVSSHLLSEVQQTVDRVVILSHGRVVHEGSLDDLGGAPTVVVDAPDRAALRAALVGANLPVADSPSGLVVTAAPADVGAAAHRAGVPLSLLQPERAGLEEVFLTLVGTGEAVDS